MDYYKILGVKHDASQEELKKAYRKKAMENHPDRTGGDDTKFKQINEAYENLKDPHKRVMHDHQKNGGGQGFNFNSAQFNSGGPDPFGDLFSGMRRQAGAYSPHINIKTTVTLKDVYTGKEQIISYKLNNGEVEHLSVNIPKGVDNGMNIRFRGYGNYTNHPQIRGDLVLNVAVKEQQGFQRQGKDLYQDLYIDALDLILGCKKQVKTLDGQTIRLNIPKGTKEFGKFKIQAYGLPDFHTQLKGNLIVTAIPVITDIKDPGMLEALRVIRNQLDNVTKK
jgi:curved DNA-binding protein